MNEVEKAQEFIGKRKVVISYSDQPIDWHLVAEAFANMFLRDYYCKSKQKVESNGGYENDPT